MSKLEKRDIWMVRRLRATTAKPLRLSLGAKTEISIRWQRS